MTLLLAGAVDATIVLAIGLAAASALRGRSAAQRHAVLAAAIGAALLAPALELVVPTWPVVRVNQAVPPPSTVSVAPADGLTLVSGPARGDTPVARAVPWTRLLLAIWGLGAFLTLAGLLTGIVRLARLRARCVPVRAGPWRALADEVSRASGLRRDVAILQSGSRALLVACGVMRPAIVLPPGTGAWTDDRRRIVLTHELAHVRRHDGAVQLAAELLRVLHWFNPLVWVACRRLRQESEHACDDAVLRSGASSTEYATHLLEIARDLAGRRRPWTPAHAIAHPSTFERRIAAMLSHQRNRDPLTRRAAVVAALGAVAVVLPLAAAGIAPGPAPAPTRPIAAGDITLIPAPRPLASAPAAAPAPPPEASARPAPAAGPASAGDVPAAPAQAVTAPGTIGGTVLDQTGGALPGAEVTITRLDTGARATTVTDAGGRFMFRQLEPAQYDMVAGLPGFGAVAHSLPLAAGATVAQIVRLPLGMIEETVTVECPAVRAAVTAPAREPMRPVARPVSHTVHARLGQAWSRVRQAIVPVLAAQANTPMPVRVGGNLRVAARLTLVTPPCPAVPLPAGETVVHFVGRIGEDGALHDVTHTTLVIASGSADAASGVAPTRALVEPARDAVRQWTFAPALLNGRPADMAIAIRVVYRRP